jgi:hypothetical protein
VDFHRFVPISDPSNDFPKQVTRLPEFRRAARRGATGVIFQHGRERTQRTQKKAALFFVSFAPFCATP